MKNGTNGTNGASKSALKGWDTRRENKRKAIPAKPDISEKNICAFSGCFNRAAGWASCRACANKQCKVQACNVHRHMYPVVTR